MLEAPNVEQHPAKATTESQAADTITSTLDRNDAVLLVKIIDDAMQTRQGTIKREEAALSQAQKALGRAKRPSTQQAKQIEIEGMQQRIANWQQDLERMERIREKLTDGTEKS